MVKFRNIDSHIPTSKFRTTKDDINVGNINVDTMSERTTGSGVTIENVLLKDGNISLGDGFSLISGTGTDLKISHNSETNFLEHSKQIQFKSTMVDGGGGSNDSYKFLESARRFSIFLFSSDNASGTERSNFYLDVGNETVDTVANSPYMKFRIRSQDTTTGIVNPLEIYQPGQTIATAKVLVNSDLYIPDSRSLFVGDNKDFQIIHTGSTTFIDEQGTGDLFVRSNGAGITMCDTTATSGNFMARFLKDGACELYHNKTKKLETTATGVTVSGDITSTSITTAFSTITAPSAYIDDPVVASHISKIDGIIVTTIFINFAPASGEPIVAPSASDAAIISKDDASPGASAITQITAAKNGTIFKVEMHCTETPSSLTDVNLVHAATALSGGTTSGQTILLNTGGLAIGKSFENLSPGDLTNKFLHLSNGTGGSSTSEQTAGKIVIRLYGASFD